MRHAGEQALGASEHAAELEALQHAVEGGPGRSTLREHLRRLAVPWPPATGEERPRPEPDPLHTRDLARIVLDHAPAAGDDAPRVVLGPWVAALDVRRPRHLRAWAASVAASAFSLHDDVRPPSRAFSRDGRRPDLADRMRLHAVGRAPPSAWRLVAPDPRGWWVEPLVPLGVGWAPRQPVDLEQVGGVDGPPQPGGLLLGRVVPGPEQAVAVAALVLPEVPPAALLAGWFARMALPQLLADRALQREELLRRGGHLLMAQAHAWWWGRRARQRASAEPGLQSP